VVISIDASVLTAYYQAKAGIPATSSDGSTSTGPGSPPTNPTPPWSAASTAPQMSALATSALNGGRFINANSTKLDAPSAKDADDYSKLFTLYQGLNALEGLASQYTATGTSSFTQQQIASRFTAGMQEVTSFLDQTKFDAFTLAQGKASASLTTTVGAKKETDVYTTAAVYSGDPTQPVPAFQGPTQFDITFTKFSGSKFTAHFDLDDMGTTPRTMANVVKYLNTQLKAAGSFSTFSVVRNAGTPRTTTVGGQTVTLGTNPDSYSLQFNGVSTETPDFSSPTAGAAVYVGAAQGTTTTTTTPGKTTTTNGVTTTAPSTTTTTSDVTQNLLKFQTDPADNATSAVDGKVFSDVLGSAVQNARASAVGPDGSVYVLTDVNGAINGQPIKGQTDVALEKYDSAGNLVYTRTLGAANNAAGYALAVSADGSRVAIGGSVTGALDSGDSGSDPTAADSFVSVFDSEGQEVWDQRRGATGDDNVTGLSFGADGTLYVQGAASASMAGQKALGGADSYVQGFKANPTGSANAYSQTFTTQYGTAYTDKPGGVAVSGSSLYVAGMEAGVAVVRQYTLQPSGAPVLAGTTSLGNLSGGSIAGLAVNQDGSVVVAGTTKAALAGTATNSFAGGQAAFVASLPADLSAGGDTVTYVNGTTGTMSASAMAVSGGQVYITGQMGMPPPLGQTTAYDGYAMAIDPSSGQTTWSQSWRGTDRVVTPSTIAVDATGSSALDRLGLPHGTIDYSGSQQVTAVTSARAGDQFVVKVNGGSAATVTIDQGDTLQDLATKVSRASGYNATVTLVTVAGVQQLKVAPANQRTTIELDAGKTGRDALASLGLKEGLITSAPDPTPKDNVMSTYGLSLPTTLSITDTTSAKNAQSVLQSALSTVRAIYANMTSPPDTPSTASSGPVPAYLTAQIADYQQALARLTGGATDTTSLAGLI
jgi:hypothetical protein